MKSPQPPFGKEGQGGFLEGATPCMVPYFGGGFAALWPLWLNFELLAKGSGKHIEKSFPTECTH
jgi:hypothetical protein